MHRSICIRVTDKFGHDASICICSSIGLGKHRSDIHCWSDTSGHIVPVGIIRQYGAGEMYRHVLEATVRWFLSLNSDWYPIPLFSRRQSIRVACPICLTYRPIRIDIQDSFGGNNRYVFGTTLHVCSDRPTPIDIQCTLLVAQSIRVEWPTCLQLSPNTHWYPILFWQ